MGIISYWTTSTVECRRFCVRSVEKNNRFFQMGLAFWNLDTFTSSSIHVSMVCLPAWMVEFYGTLAGDINFIIFIFTQSSHGSVMGNEACVFVEAHPFWTTWIRRTVKLWPFSSIHFWGGQLGGPWWDMIRTYIKEIQISRANASHQHLPRNHAFFG